MDWFLYDLLRKSMDWLLYDNGLRHERVKLVNSKHEDQASVHNDSLSRNLFICWAEICRQCFSLF